MDLNCFNLTCPDMICSNLTCPNMTCPCFTYPDMTSPDLTCPDLTCLYFTCLDLTSPDLTCPRHLSGSFKAPSRHPPDMPWPVQTWPVLTWPVLIWPAPGTFKTPSIHPLDSLRTSSRPLPDTVQTHFRTLSRSLQGKVMMPLKYSPNITHVGSFLLVEVRCGFLLLFFFFCLWQGENIVNSYSNQPEFSSVCKSEWSLTKVKCEFCLPGICARVGWIMFLISEGHQGLQQHDVSN